MKHFGSMSLYSKETYIAAYHWFGWKLPKAERMYEQGKRYDCLVAEYLKHMEK